MISGRGGRGKIRPPRRNILSGVRGGSGENDFDAMWDILKNALREIHTKNASKLAFEALYRASYKIVLKKRGDDLYDRVKEYEEHWFATEVMPRMHSLITGNLVAIAAGGAPGTTTNERRVTGERFLKGLKESWEDHNLCMNMITDVLMYMDRVYCADQKRPSIFTTTMGLFRIHILRSKLDNSDSELVTFDILNSVLLDHIHMEREGDVIDKHLVRSCVYMLEGLYETDEENENEKLYTTVFEPAFLLASEKFYKKECETLLRESDASTWLRQTAKRLVEENERCRTTISPLSNYKIAKVVETELIQSHFAEFIAMEGSGIRAMIENDRYDDLTLLYLHIARIDSKKELLRKALQERVVGMGSEINKTITATKFSAKVLSNGDDANEDSSNKPKTPTMTAAAQQTAAAIKWVDEVLALKDKFDKMWKICFKEDLVLQTALTKSFSDFINLFPRSSEYVSLFIDDNLKRGIKGKTESEVDTVLDKAVTLLRYISDKDMFERYYKKHLARRLLHGKSESADVERQMISRMKQEIGNYFTIKLEGMFKDMALSEDLTSGYRNYVEDLGDKDKKQIDLGVSVLTSNFWPMESMGGAAARTDDGTNQSITWPPEIKTLQDSFTKFYLKERNGRQLSWLGFIGTADLRCVFPKIPGKEGALGRERRHELNVPTFGMVVLLLFNNLGPQESLSFEEIQQRTLIPPANLVHILTTLAVLPKARVLTKEPATKQVKPGDKFFFNQAFTSKAVKIKAPTITAVNKVEGDEERKDTESRNDVSRGGAIEACIVRIMKQRKELAHSALLSEVISQLSSRFKPDITMVKKRVESLIEREYLERVEEAAMPTYRYLA